MNLQELADMPGYGKAAKQLRKSGHFIEEIIMEDLMDWLDDKVVIVIEGDNMRLHHNGENDWHEPIETKMQKAMAGANQ